LRNIFIAFASRQGWSCALATPISTAATPPETVAGWLHDVEAGNLIVDGTSEELSGALLTVCPWWDGVVSRAEVEVEFARQAGMIKRPWIWVYHAPPAGSAVCWNGRKFVGDEFLRESITRLGPDLVLSGHIHDAPFYPGGA
jgi:hypothetical protein